ncbi:MAG: GxxExxY protein [Anaerolineales bacterium]
MGKLLYEELSYQIRGVLMEVYNTLGPGFREETYKLATLAEMRQQSIRTAREFEIEIRFKGEIIDKYRIDIVVDEKVILELKSVEQFHPRHHAQLLSYLKASGLRLGLLVNFGADKLEIERIVN